MGFVEWGRPVNQVQGGKVAWQGWDLPSHWNVEHVTPEVEEIISYPPWEDLPFVYLFIFAIWDEGLEP